MQVEDAGDVSLLDVGDVAVAPRAVVKVATMATHGMPRDKALALWRSMIARFPDEASYAEQYVFELLLTENWDELDRFEREAQRYSSEDLALRFIDVALARGNGGHAAALSARFILQFGRKPAVLVRKFSVYLLQRDFVGAEQVALDLAGMLPQEARRANYLAGRARQIASATEGWSETMSPERDYDIFLVNLDSDLARLERAKRQLDGHAFVRVSGVKGAHLPQQVLAELTRGKGQMQKGTVGCFLSHVGIWERVVSSGRPALVLEDDAWVVAGLPPTLGALPIPAGFDILFVNERMVPATLTLKSLGFDVTTAGKAALSKGNAWTSAGTDGYLISPQGAGKLLKYVAEDGLAGDVDWRLISYALTDRQRDAVSTAGGFTGRAVDFHRQFHGGRRSLRAYSLTPSLVRQFAGGSVRLWDNELAHSHVEQVRAHKRKKGETLG